MHSLTYDSAYDAIVREHLAARAPGAGFAAQVIKAFKRSALDACSGAIGRWVTRQLDRAALTQDEVASRLGVERSIVSKWTGDQPISLENLVALLIEFYGDFAALGLPPREVLVLRGYRAALALIRAELGAAPDGRGPDDEEVWSLVHLFAEPHWAGAMRRQDPHGLASEAVRVAAAVRAALGRAPVRVVGVEGLKRLVNEWGAPWLICLGTLPRAWAIR
jgi:transcriptional regulator with XRE-family HTH domain